VKPEIAEIWALALESGDYEQGSGKLVQGHRDHIAPKYCCVPKYCCLGVLCDLADKAGVRSNLIDNKLHGWGFGTNGATLPEVVLEWAGMKTPSGEFGPGPIDSLMIHNDNGDSFPEIAAIIRAHVEQL
jgi:hypothetical protein